MDRSLHVHRICWRNSEEINVLCLRAMVKKVLRPYAAGSGKVLYSNGDDLALLQKESLRNFLTADVSEISRRSADGWSMMGAMR